GVDELVDLRKGGDVVELPFDLGSAHTEDRPFQEDVLPARQLAVKACADLEERTHAAVDLDPSLGRRGDTGEDFQECALPCTVSSYDPKHVSTRDIERDVAHGPDRLVRPLPGLAQTSKAAHRRPG